MESVVFGDHALLEKNVKFIYLILILDFRE